MDVELKTIQFHAEFFQKYFQISVNTSNSINALLNLVRLRSKLPEPMSSIISTSKMH